MSIYPLDTLSKEGATRLAVEVLVVFGVVALLYLFAIEPVLQSVAPAVYAQGVSGTAGPTAPTRPRRSRSCCLR